MTAGISRKDLKRDELVDATLDAGKWIERHGRTAGVAALIVVVAGLGFLGWRWNVERREARAGERLAEGEKLYRAAEKASFPRADVERALESFGRAAELGGTGPAGRLASYWRGAALHRLDRSAEAAAGLERLYASPATPPTLAGSAKALAADALAAAGQPERAVALLEELVSADPEIFPADQALSALAALRERSGDAAGARRAWQSIVDRFPGRSTAAAARERLGS